MPAEPAVHPADETLVAYGLGKTDAATAEAVARHLEGCPSCRDRVAGASADSFLGRLRQAAGGSGGTPHPVKPLDGVAGTMPTGGAGRGSFGAGRPAALPPELAGLPDYADVRELGRGGMGVVYLATNTLLKRPEVLKVLGREFLDRPGARDRFLREMQSAAQLGHPNVVRAYTALRLGDLLVFAMEYVAGDNLADVVKARGPLPVQSACFYAHQAALGLQHAHEGGMVHRDIKPGNLMLTRVTGKPVVKVLDFGLAKATSEKAVDGGLTGDGKMMGTPDYMAPEQALDAARADIRADVYSLGCTLYYLLSGRPPFAADSLYGLLRLHQETEAERLNLVRPEVPAELAAVVAKMMAKDPGKRYQTPAEVAKVLAPFVKPGAAPRPAPEVSQGGAATAAPVDTSPPAPPPGPAAPTPAPQPGWTPPSVFRDGPLPNQTHHLNMEDIDPPPRRPAKPKAESPAAAPEQAGRATRPKRPAAGGGWKWPAVAAGVVLAAVAVAWAAGAFKAKTKYGTIVVENVPAGAEVEVDGETVTITRDGEAVTVTATKDGTFRLRAVQGGVEVWAKEVTVKLGGDPVKIRMEKPPPPKDPPSKTPPAAAEPSAGFVPLFNGKDLAGWRPEAGTPKTWAVENGELVGRSQGPPTRGCLLSGKEYADFTVRFDFIADRNPGGGTGGGLVLRAADGEQLPGPKGAIIPNHPMVRLTDPARSPDYPLGTQFYLRDGRPHLKPDPVPDLKVGQWHRGEVTVVGDRCVVVLGGRPVWDVRLDPDPATHRGIDPALKRAKGRVGFHVQRGAVRYRNVEIRELAAPDPKAAATPPAADGFVPLFNGKDLTGWKSERGTPDTWAVAAGELTGRSQDGTTRGYLLSDKEYADFTVRFEYQVDAGGSGGLAVRAADGEQLPVPKGFVPDHPLLRLCDTARFPTFGLGALRWARDGRFNVKPDPVPDLKAGEWHRAEVTVVGDRLTAVLGGQPVWDTRLDPDPATHQGIAPALKRAKGRVGFYIADGMVRYRNVEIKELPPTDPKAPAGALPNGPDTRTRWAHASGTGREAVSGVFCHADGKAWFESITNPDAQRLYWFTEAARTGEYIELERPGVPSKIVVRLYADRAEVQLPSKPLRKFYDGGWKPPAKAAVALAKPGGRPVLNPDDLVGWRAGGDPLEASPDGLVLVGGPARSSFTTARSDFTDCVVTVTLSASKSTDAFLVNRATSPGGKWAAATSRVNDDGDEVRAGSQRFNFQTSEGGLGRKKLKYDQLFELRYQVKGNVASVWVNDVFTSGTDYGNGGYPAKGAGGLVVNEGSVTIRALEVRQLNP